MLYLGPKLCTKASAERRASLMEEAEQALIRVIGSKGLLAVLQAVKPASNKQVRGLPQDSKGPPVGN